ncbi:MAG: endonuclease/exonuclease/phosphatase family protein [Verrucomicrobia bacterium]|nr:endonuclease/exonuclease/phosphatase family protein [Verrucomicrobiota bacterium]
MHSHRARGFAVGVFSFALSLRLIAADTFSVGAYNVENYLDAPAGTRPMKSVAAKAKVRESIKLLGVDVIAFEEMGGTNAFLELRASLKADGVDYPHWEHVSGWDTNIHVAVLSKFPITARRPHTNESFLLSGRRCFVSRGFGEVDLQVSAKFSFTLLFAHLKSKRPVPEADQAELREQEAILLREKIDRLLTENRNARFAVVGDFNDTKESKAIRTVIGHYGSKQLVDTRPAERNGDPRTATKKGYSPMNIAWTYFYGKEDTYSRIDYILLSKAMAESWDEKETYVLALPRWGEASDHRPIKATFRVPDK